MDVMLKNGKIANHRVLSSRTKLAQHVAAIRSEYGQIEVEIYEFLADRFYIYFHV